MTQFIIAFINEPVLVPLRHEMVISYLAHRASDIFIYGGQFSFAFNLN